jgi:hypothetical protein
MIVIRKSFVASLLTEYEGGESALSSLSTAAGVTWDSS